MPPTLRDDGDTVTLDLHGARVDEAERLALRTVREAHRRGRSRVRIIHGTSTSSTLYANRTIKHAVRELVERDLKPLLGGDWAAEGFVILSLAPSGGADRRPIRPADVGMG